MSTLYFKALDLRRKSGREGSSGCGVLWMTPETGVERPGLVAVVESLVEGAPVGPPYFGGREVLVQVQVSDVADGMHCSGNLG